MSADYAWVITEDYLEDGTGDAGIKGPSDAPDDLLAQLDAGKGHTFRLYDDDGILYYTGRLVTSTSMDEEEHTYAPLRDFGQGWAGCAAVRWPGHPEWDVS